MYSPLQWFHRARDVFLAEVALRKAGIARPCRVGSVIAISPPAPGRLILIDAHGIIFQVFHAIRDRMTSPAGLPTNALFGFTRDMLFLRAQRPEYLVCAFDASEITFRNTISVDYKAHRPPMPDDLRVQIPLIHKVLDALSIPVLGHDDFEADDILATVAKAGAARGL